MLIVKLGGDVPLIGGRVMTAKRKWIVTSATAGMMLNDFRKIGGYSISSLTQIERIQQEEYDPAKCDRVIMFRGGGFGDIMMMVPTIRALVASGKKVTVACADVYAPVLQGQPCDVMQVPIALDEIGQRDFLAMYEGTIEDSQEARTTHAVDLFAKPFGIKGIDRSLSWVVSEEEALEAKAYPKSTYRVGVQVEASTPVRTYHIDLLSIVIQQLAEAGVEVVLFGRSGRIKVDIPNVLNLSNVGLTFRQSAAVVATCDCMITPDSSLFHVAQALGVPTVALFGPFPFRLRETNPVAVHVLEAKADCAPCFHHSHDGAVMPSDGPCSIAKFCTALASINPARILEAVMNILNA